MIVFVIAKIDEINSTIQKFLIQLFQQSLCSIIKQTLPEEMHIYEKIGVRTHHQRGEERKADVEHRQTEIPTSLMMLADGWVGTVVAGVSEAMRLEYFLNKRNMEPRGKKVTWISRKNNRNSNILTFHSLSFDFSNTGADMLSTSVPNQYGSRSFLFQWETGIL